MLAVHDSALHCVEEAGEWDQLILPVGAAMGVQLMGVGVGPADVKVLGSVQHHFIGSTIASALEKNGKNCCENGFPEPPNNLD
jgi:hypothetical protein